MFESLAQGASHPAVAAWFGLGAAAVAAVVVAMAWSVNTRQIRLAELLARRQFPLSSGNVAAKESTPEVEGGAAAAKEGAARAKPAAKVPPEVIDGPDEVVAGEQARYRVQTGGPHQVVSWAVGGGGGMGVETTGVTGTALAWKAASYPPPDNAAMLGLVPGAIASPVSSVPADPYSHRSPLLPCAATS